MKKTLFMLLTLSALCAAGCTSQPVVSQLAGSWAESGNIVSTFEIASDGRVLLFTPPGTVHGYSVDARNLKYKGASAVPRPRWMYMIPIPIYGLNTLEELEVTADSTHTIIREQHDLRFPLNYRITEVWVTALDQDHISVRSTQTVHLFLENELFEQRVLHDRRDAPTIYHRRSEDFWSAKARIERGELTEEERQWKQNREQEEAEKNMK